MLGSEDKIRAYHKGVDMLTEKERTFENADYETARELILFENKNLTHPILYDWSRRHHYNSLGIQLCGYCIHLKEDGTWWLECTMGG